MKVLRAKAVSEMTGLSRVTIWRWERNGEFPKRIRLGANSVGWIQSEVVAWVENLAQNRITHIERKDHDHQIN